MIFNEFHIIKDIYYTRTIQNLPLLLILLPLFLQFQKFGLMNIYRKWNKRKKKLFLKKFILEKNN